MFLNTLFIASVAVILVMYYLRSPMMMTLSVMFMACYMGLVLMKTCSFWAGSSLMMLYISGLLVLFTYLSSLAKPLVSNIKINVWIMLGIILFFTVANFVLVKPVKVHKMGDIYMVNYELMLVMIFIISLVTLLVVKMVKPGQGALKM